MRLLLLALAAALLTPAGRRRADDERADAGGHRPGIGRAASRWRPVLRRGDALFADRRPGAAQVNARAVAIVAGLRSVGIAEEQITTGGLSLSRTRRRVRRNGPRVTATARPSR